MDSSGVDREWLQNSFPDLTDIQQITGGGQKFVFTASHELDGEVVLKILQTHDVENFRRELLAVSAIRNRRIPAIFGEGSVPSPLGPCLWIREKKISGNNLRIEIAKSHWNLISTLRMADHVSEALSAAESANIVHRDVKPDNIMADQANKYWLIDFGIARHLSLPSLTPSSAPFGKYTPGYAPLEQCTNQKSDIDARCDIFALGVTIYESLCGINPYRHNATDETEVLNRLDSIQNLKLDDNYTKNLRDLISTCTQCDHNDRPNTMSEVRKWISEIYARHVTNEEP